jgi:hypothetical protein
MIIRYTRLYLLHRWAFVVSIRAEHQRTLWRDAYAQHPDLASLRGLEYIIRTAITYS